MKLVVVGTGYVGLVTGACFSEMGNHVICVDVDRDKLARLNRGEIPIYEPGLEQVVEHNFRRGSLEFTGDLRAALDGAHVAVIAVGTPPDEDGSADLRSVLEVARSLGEHMTNYLVIADKSTVPVGTAEKVEAEVTKALTTRGVDISFDVVSNPEFLKEGNAVEDFMRPDRVVIGANSDRARLVLSELYEPFSRTRDKLIFMGVRDAEMTKYAAALEFVFYFVSYTLLVPYLGYLLSTVLLGLFLPWRLGYRSRTWMIRSLCSSLAIVIIFRSFLQIKTPVSIWLYDQLPSAFRGFMLTYF